MRRNTINTHTVTNNRVSFLQYCPSGDKDQATAVFDSQNREEAD